MKVVINTSRMGFNLSHKAIERFAELEGLEVTKLESPIYRNFYYYVIYESGRQVNVNGMIRDNHEYRTNENLVKVIEELGTEASSFASCIKVVEIPDEVNFYIASEDDAEEIHEVHRVWS